nr:hypothetical protein [Myxococcota bacterium]
MEIAERAERRGILGAKLGRLEEQGLGLVEVPGAPERVALTKDGLTTIAGLERAAVLGQETAVELGCLVPFFGRERRVREALENHPILGRIGLRVRVGALRLAPVAELPEGLAAAEAHGLGVLDAHLPGAGEERLVLLRRGGEV